MINSRMFRRENWLLAAALLTFLGTVGIVCYLLYVRDTATIGDAEIVIASLLAASASWAGIQSWHRVSREQQRSGLDLQSAIKRERDDDEFGGER